jgi:hypothetical protein
VENYSNPGGDRQLTEDEEEAVVQQVMLMAMRNMPMRGSDVKSLIIVSILFADVCVRLEKNSKQCSVSNVL